MKRSHVTYAQLDKVLRALGFACRHMTDDPPPTRVYQHKTAGAMIVLPELPESEKVYEHHLVVVRGELDNFGIADPTALDARLQRAS